MHDKIDNVCLACTIYDKALEPNLTNAIAKVMHLYLVIAQNLLTSCSTSNQVVVLMKELAHPHLPLSAQTVVTIPQVYLVTLECTHACLKLQELHKLVHVSAVRLLCDSLAI